MNALNNIANLFGSGPIDTGATDVTFPVPVYGIEVWEDTTFLKFYDANDKELPIEWAGKAVTVDSGAKLILFGRPISRITFSAGGYGQYLKAKAE